MNRIERRLLKVTDELEALAREEALVAGELEMHRHLDDDAQRDAAVHGSPGDRVEAYETRKDVARFKRTLERLRARRTRLEDQRASLLGRLEGRR